MPNDTGVPAIAELIYYIRGHRVMLDWDLATIYGVETRILTRAVKRNIDRFPGDFMFQLSDQEVAALRFQFGTSRATDIAYSLATGEGLHFPLLIETGGKIECRVVNLLKKSYPALRNLLRISTITLHEWLFVFTEWFRVGLRVHAHG